MFILTPQLLYNNHFSLHPFSGRCTLPMKTRRRLTVERSDAHVNCENAKQRVSLRANQFHLQRHPHGDEPLGGDHHNEPGRSHFRGFPEPKENFAANLRVGANVQLGQFNCDRSVEGM